MRILVLAVVLLALAVPGASAQDAAEALRSDPVYVDPDAEPMLTAEEADELRDRIGDSAVFVAILPEAAGEPTEVARALAEDVGRSGTYAVVAGTTSRQAPARRPLTRRPRRSRSIATRACRSCCSTSSTDWRTTATAAARAR